jgi:hypothetical protein
MYLKLGATIGLTAFLVCGGNAFAAEYRLQNWPADFDKVPCEAWVHNPDGSWSSAPGAVIIAGLSTRMEGLSFRKNTEAQLLDARCGKK